MRIYLVEYNFVAGNIRYSEPFDPQAIKAAGYDAVAIPVCHGGRDLQGMPDIYKAIVGAGMVAIPYIRIVDEGLTYGMQLNDLALKLRGRTWGTPVVMITGEQARRGHQLRGDLEFCLSDFVSRQPIMLGLNRSSYGQLFNTDTQWAELPGFIKLAAKCKLWWFAWNVDEPVPPDPWTVITVWGRGEQDNVTDWGEPTNPTPEPDPDADTKPNFMVSRDDLLKVVDALRKAIEAL